MPDGHETALSPEQAVDRLEALACRGGAGATRRAGAFCRGRRAAGSGGAAALPLSRTSPGVGAEWADAGHPPRLGQAPDARRLCHDGYPARLLPSVPARATAAAGRGIWCLHPRCTSATRRCHTPTCSIAATNSPTAAPRRPSWHDISPRPCCRRWATRWRTGCGRPRRDRLGRWRCSMRCGSITRCVACCTIPAPTGAASSLGSC